MKDPASVGDGYSYANILGFAECTMPAVVSKIVFTDVQRDGVGIIGVVHTDSPVVPGVILRRMKIGTV